MADFLNAVRTRNAPACRPEDGYPSTTAVQLGMIAYRSGGVVRWNRQTEQIEGNPAGAGAAEARLSRTLRPSVHRVTRSMAAVKSFTIGV